jgi:hypothetical protein
MADTVAPEYILFVEEERRAQRLPAPAEALADGEVERPVFIANGQATELLRVAAKRAAGFFHPTKRTEVVWVQGESELAVSLVGLDVRAADGLIRVRIPVRCDQAGEAVVEVVFAVGSATEPSGLFASTHRRPNGPPLVVEVWGEALVAYAWQCVLGMITGIAGAIGKDARGNVLVPVELLANAKGFQIVPMARHRFAGSSGLLTTSTKRGSR